MPAQSAPPVVGLPSGSGVELYDARLDPWNAPDECQAAPSVPRDQGMPVGAVGCHFVQGQLNPAASAFYPDPQSGCLDTPPALPRFGVDGLGSMPSPVRGNDCGVPQASLPTENALPGCGPWVHVCSCPCRVCGAPCILQRAGHTNHLCEIHKIP